MHTPKSSVIAAGTTASTILFLVFCGWTIYDSQSARKVSELGIETIAPENLKRATEVFQLKLKVEAKGFPVDAMMQTKAWEGLVRSAEGYAERLELLERQNRQRSVAVSVISALAALSMALFAWLERKGRKKAGGEV